MLISDSLFIHQGLVAARSEITAKHGLKGSDSTPVLRCQELHSGLTFESLVTD